MTYFGAKGREAKRIISHMPYHETYIEGFLGSGQVMLTKPPAPITIGIELDRSTIDRYDYPEGAKIINGCAIEFLSQMTLAPYKKPLIYLDPPYHPDTRTSSHGYSFDMGPQAHETLLQLITSLEDNIMLSGYRCALYDDYLSDWRRVDYETMTRGGVRLESLWMNFSAPQPYHHSQAGKNRTDRQRIARKADRWAKNYENMTEGERLAIRAALAAVDDRLQS